MMEKVLPTLSSILNQNGGFFVIQVGGPPTLLDVDLFQSVRNQAYFIVDKIKIFLSRAHSFSRAMCEIC